MRVGGATSGGACRSGDGVTGLAPSADDVFFFSARILAFGRRNLGLVAQQHGELVGEGIDTTCGPLEESEVIENGGHGEHGERHRFVAVFRQVTPLGDVAMQRRPCRQCRALPIRRIGDRIDEIREVAKRILDGVGVDFSFAKLGVVALQGDELE